MKKIWTVLLLLISIFLFAAEINSILPVYQQNEVIFQIQSSEPFNKADIFVEKSASNAVISVHLKGTELLNTPFFLPIAYGPVDSLRAIGTYQGTLLIFQLLIPVDAKIDISQQTLQVKFPVSEKRIDLVLTSESDFETAVKFLAEEMNLNVVVSDSVKSIKMALKLSGISPEDALRNLLITAKVGDEPIAYSYMPDGTLHIGTRNEISFRFNQFWGIYDVKNEEVVKKLETILSPTTVMTYLPNKAVLFVYGSLFEQDLISKILSVTPPSITKEITISVPKDDVFKLLDSLKNIYNFEYNSIEGLNKIIIKGDSKIVQSVLNYIKELETKFQQISKSTEESTPVVQTKIKQFKVVYPEEATEILSQIGLETVKMPFGVIEVKGSDSQLKIAESILNDFGLFKAEYEHIFIPEKFQDSLISILSNIFGIPASRFIKSEDNGIIVFAPEDIRKSARDISDDFVKFLMSRKKSEIFFLNDYEVASQVSDILKQIYGIESNSVQNVLKVVGTDEDLNKARNFIATFVKDRTIRSLEVQLDDDVYSELKTLMESTLDVKFEANLKSLRRILISSYNKEDLNKAAAEIKKITETISSLKIEKDTKLVPALETINFDDIKLLLTKLYEVDVEKTDLFYILSGEKAKIEQAEKFLSQLSGQLSEKTSKVYRITQIPEGFSVQELVEVLNKLTKVEVLTAGQTMVLWADKQSVENAEKILQELIANLPKVSETEKKITVKVIEYSEKVPFEEFTGFLQSIGNTSKLSAYPNLGVVVISGYEEDVQDAINNYKNFQEIVQQKSELAKVETQPVKISKNEDGSIAVKCNEISLREVISEIARELNISMVFIAVPEEKITMNVSSINWKQFTDLIQSQYGYAFLESDNVTVLIKPRSVTDTTTEEKFVYTLPHNLDRIKSLIEFYGGKVYIDELNDLMVVTGLSKKMKDQLDQTILQIAQPLKQIEIEAKLVDRSLIDEITRQNSLSISLPGQAPEITVSSTSLSLSTSVINLFDYQKLFSYLSGASVTAVFELNNSNNLDNLLASPRIVTSSGKEARILIGDRVPYQTIDADGNVIVNFLDTGIELRITPYVRTDGTIELNIFTKVSKPTYYPNIDIPGESTRETETDVILKNGDTLVIGGLMRETKEETSAKMPFLGDLPFIGQLFRSKTEKADKRELLIFITARVIEQ